MITLHINEMLDVLSNNYRREILRLLTIEDRYAFELTKKLNISQRAVTKHLKFLEEIGLVSSEKRKSSKGPEREYFKLNKSVVLSLTIAPNLFFTTLRPLDESKAHPPITPSLQLGMPKKERTVKGVIKESMELLPQIKEGLDLLQAQQSRLLRAYQGMQGHVSEYLSKNGFNEKEIRLILNLMENDGMLTDEEIKFIYGDVSAISNEINSLQEKEIIKYEILDKKNGLSFRIMINE